MEAALLKTVGPHLTYSLEDDGFIACRAYDKWSNTLSLLQRVVNADEDSIEPIIEESEALKGDHQLVHTTTQKVISSLLNMEQDEFGRLSLTLRVLRACRLFDYVFVSQIAIEALRDDDDGEIRFLRILRTCQEGKDLYKSIKDQLITYEELA